jgi:predicted Zn-dependent protease
MSYDEFVYAVVGGRVDEAIANLRSTAAGDVDHVLLKEFYLDRLAVSLVFTWGLSEEGLRVIELNAELHPESNRVQVTLAEAYAAVGNNAAAIEVYSRYVEKYPDDTRAKSRLERLRGL